MKKRSVKKEIDQGERSSTKRETDQGAISAIAKRVMILNKHIEQEGPPQVEDAIDEFDASLEQQEREMEAEGEGADAILKSEFAVAETDHLQVGAEASLEELDMHGKELGLEEADDQEAAEKPAEDLVANPGITIGDELFGYGFHLDHESNPDDLDPGSKPDDPEPKLIEKRYDLRSAFKNRWREQGGGETGRDRDALKGIDVLSSAFGSYRERRTLLEEL